MTLRRWNPASVWHVLPLAICLAPCVALAADPSTDCAPLSDDRARLACYDRIFRDPAASDRNVVPAVTSPTPTSPATAVAGPPAAPIAAPSAAGAVTPPAAAATVASNPQDDFGLTEAAKQARDPQKARTDMPQSITQEVASVRRKPTGELVVTLASGQVWTQVEADQRARVRAGDTVTIKKAALGSYLLVTASKLATRVRRTQ